MGTAVFRLASGCFRTRVDVLTGNAREGELGDCFRD